MYENHNNINRMRQRKKILLYLLLLKMYKIRIANISIYKFTIPCKNKIRNNDKILIRKIILKRKMLPIYVNNTFILIM